MAELRDILYNVRITSTSGDMNRDVTGITFDSRLAQPSLVFVAIKGTQSDGHAFIEKAITAGCQIIVCESLPENMMESVTYITVKNSALGIMAGNYYGNPSKKLKLVA